MTSEKYYLGVDGGGTKTEALISNFNGAVIGRGISGPSNPLFIHKPIALQAVTQAVAQAKQGKIVRFKRAALCVPGLLSYFTESELSKELGISENILVNSGDELSTFYASLGGEYGVVVLAGTGSFAMGRDSTGKKVTLGGWGPLLGDEGSGYMIGRNSLLAVIDEFEGRGEPTLLTTLIQDQYSISTIDALRERIYTSDTYQKDISALARLTLKAAQSGDVVAVRILRNTGRILGKLAAEVARHLTLDPVADKIVLTGGVSKIGDFIWKPFTRQVKALLPGFQVGRPRFAPAAGALLVAYKDVGLPFSAERLNELERSYREIVSIQESSK